MKSKIQYLFSLIAFSLTLSYGAFAQTATTTSSQKIGANPTSISPSAVLEVESSNKGVLFPRIALASSTDVTKITSPVLGLTIFNTASAGTSPNVVTPGYYYWNGTKWVKLAIETPFAKTVYVNATSPSSATVFDENNPPETNNNALKADDNNVYIGSDGSTWTFDPTSPGTYKTFVVPASTPFNLASTTTDAGSNKTSSIWRSGNIGIGMNNPSAPLEVQTPLKSTYVTTAKFLAPQNTNAGNNTLLNFGVSATTGNSADWRYVYQGGGTGTNRVDFGMSGYSAPMISYLNNGNVGIGTTAPITKLSIQGPTAATGANANAQMLRMSRPILSGQKWDNIAQFNLGTYFDDAVGANNIDAKSRLDLALTNGNNNTTFTNVMTWHANGNVGINTTTPSAPLVIQGLSGNGSLKLIAPVVNSSGDNWWMGFGHGTTSTDANDRARIGVDILAGGSGRLFFTTGATGAQTRAMFIDESQKVGIGTSTPTERLHVLGNVLATGSVSAASYVTSSDSRLKTNVIGINNGLNKIMQLKPVNYDKKISLDSAATVNENGFIAQELQKVMPELVSQGKDKDKLLSVNYTAIIPVLTKAVQEQQKIIEQNQATIQKQQEQINELKLLLEKVLEKK